MKNQKEKSFQINQSANTDNKNYGKQIKSWTDSDECLYEQRRKVSNKQNSLMPQRTIKEQWIQPKGKKMWGSQLKYWQNWEALWIWFQTTAIKSMSRKSGLYTFSASQCTKRLYLRLQSSSWCMEKPSISSHSTSEHLNDKANITRPKVRNTVTVGTAIPPLSSDRKWKHKNIGPSYTLQQLNLIDMTWSIYPSAAKYTFFSRAQNIHQIRARVQTQTGFFFKAFIESLILLPFFFYVFFFFFFCWEACGIITPRPGVKPACPALEGEVLTSGPPGKSPKQVFNRFKPENT